MIRPERPDDEDAIRAVETAAFGRDNEARIVDGLRAGAAFIPQLSLVAEGAGACVFAGGVDAAAVEAGAFALAGSFETDGAGAASLPPPGAASFTAIS